MSCTRNQEVSTYHDAEMIPSVREAFESHLRDCADCTAELARLRALSRWIAAAPTPAMSSAAAGRFAKVGERTANRMLLTTAEALSGLAAAILLGSLLLLWQGDAGVTPSASPASWEALAIAPAGGEESRLAAAEDRTAAWIVEGLGSEK